MKTRLLFVILLGILMVSCQKNESNAVVEEQENFNNNGNQNNNGPKDSVVTVTEGNVVEHAFTRADAAPLVVTLTDREKAMFESGYPFAISMFEKQIANAGTENVCISPLSVQILLGILTNGLNDTTAARMMEIMFGPDVTVQDMNSGYGKLNASLEATNCARLSNALWMQKGQTFNDDFLSVGQGIYQSTVRYLDFERATQSAMDSICQWAYDNSYGRVKNLDVGDLNTNTIMVVGNLTWFASAWAYAFSTSNTTKGKFTLADGSVKEVDMMCMKTSRGVKYKVLDKYKVLSMPFVNNAFRMDFYVPNSEYTLDEVIPEFDWSVKPSGGTVKIQMPKFTMECKNDIRQLLESCGMKEMFNVGVFDRMTSKDNDANIQNIKQDVKIKVEESGVEAVAVTLGFLNTRSGPYNFDIDRPFVFAIRDNASGSFLFMGRVNDIN